MTQIEISKKVFNDFYYPDLKNYAREQIYFGGSSSGKSWFLAQRTVIDVLGGDRNYLICRKVQKYVKKSVWKDVVGVINQWGLSHLFKINVADFEITCKSNNKQILFIGLDDVEKVKSIRAVDGAITDVWIEEATEVDKNDIKQLKKRQRGGDNKILKRITFSFNPIYKTHWIYNDYFKHIGWTELQTEFVSDRLTIKKSTYKDNRFLTPGDIEDLETEEDSYFYQVYTLGNWGVLGNVIFKNWKVQDLSKMVDQFTNRRAGLDFGFADDPAASTKTHYDKTRKIIYIYDELYETGLVNTELYDKLLPMHGKDRITADSADPKSIEELRRLGLNIRGAKKGKDSVVFGIQWIQQQNVIIDSKCINAQNEFSMYKWKEDAGGNALPVPVDKNNHIIDQLRYAYEDDMEQRETKTIKNPFGSL
jgi:phage terminase large subunit